MKNFQFSCPRRQAIFNLQKRNRPLITDHRQLNTGFTFIEILVSFAILLILISVSFAGYASLNQRQMLLSSGQNLKSILRDAQSRAYNGEIDCSPGVCNCPSGISSNLEGWHVNFSSGLMYGKCGTDIVPITFSPKPLNLVSGITITPFITPPSDISFKSYPHAVSQPATLCLSYANLPGKFYRIMIDSAGSIYDDGSLIDPPCGP